MTGIKIPSDIDILENTSEPQTHTEHPRRRRRESINAHSPKTLDKPGESVVVSENTLSREAIDAVYDSDVVKRRISEAREFATSIELGEYPDFVLVEVREAIDGTMGNGELPQEYADPRVAYMNSMKVLRNYLNTVMDLNTGVLKDAEADGTEIHRLLQLYIKTTQGYASVKAHLDSEAFIQALQTAISATLSTLPQLINSAVIDGLGHMDSQVRKEVMRAVREVPEHINTRFQEELESHMLEQQELVED